MLLEQLATCCFCNSNVVNATTILLQQQLHSNSNVARATIRLQHGNPVARATARLLCNHQVASATKLLQLCCTRLLFQQGSNLVVATMLLLQHLPCCLSNYVATRMLLLEQLNHQVAVASSEAAASTTIMLHHCYCSNSWCRAPLATARPIGLGPRACAGTRPAAALLVASTTLQVGC